MSAVGRMQDERDDMEARAIRAEEKLVVVREYVELANQAGQFPSRRRQLLTKALEVIDEPAPWGVA